MKHNKPTRQVSMRMFLTLVLIMMSSAFAMAQETYGIKIAGEDITGYNRYDLTEISGVSGKVYFDPNTRTLTLDNATIEANDYNAILNETCDYLTIELIGTNNIYVTGAAGIYLKEETTIWSNSGGKLSVKSDGCALLFGGCPLKISNCWLEAEGAWGISARNNVAEEVLTIRNSHVEAKGSTGSICDIANLVLEGCSITQPDGAWFSTQNNAVVLNGEMVTDKVVIVPSYGIKIAGVDVTSLNSKDLSVIDGVDGKMSYNPETKTLTMEDVTINITGENVGIWNKEVKGLKINLVGNNTITSSKACISINKTSTISGSGTLRLKSSDNCGLYLPSSLTVEGISLYTEGSWGIAGYASQKSGNVLTICNSYVEATGSSGSICDLQNLVLDGCSITQPTGAAFDANVHAVALNGEAVTDKVVIEPDSYGIKIAGVDVTSLNCKDLSVIDGVDGKMSYDPETNTLTMEDVTINTTDFNGIVNRDVKDMKIKLFGNNIIIITSKKACITIYETSTISGSGTLSLKSSGDCGLYMHTSLTVEGVKLYAEGKYGVAGDDGMSGEILTLRNSYVEATGSSGSICDLQNLVLDGCSITQPTGAAFDANVHAVALNGEAVTDKVVIEPDSYGIKIAGVDVTSLNCKDLSVIDGVDGKMSYDPETNTLTMEDVTINTTDFNGIVNRDVKDMKIKLFGNNIITSKNKVCITINKTSTISGSGTLRLKSGENCGIYVKSSLTVEGVKLYAEGYYGVAGDDGTCGEILTLRNSYVEATGRRGSICDLQNLVLDGCSITQPTGAAFDANVHAVALNGKTVTDKVVIESDNNSIGTITVDVPARKQGIYNLNGVKLTQQWDDLPAGIYIVDGVKRVKN